jgi:hypothetical protein
LSSPMSYGLTIGIVVARKMTGNSTLVQVNLTGCAAPGKRWSRQISLISPIAE